MYGAREDMYAASGGGGWNGAVGIYTTPGQQTTVGPAGQQTAQTPFDIAGADPIDRSTSFQPVLTTQVSSKFVKKGDFPADVLTFSTVADAAGVNNPWFKSSTTGNYAPITEKGSLYYTSYEPTELAVGEIPADAELVGNATATTDPAAGPTQAYTVTSDKAAEKSGYYTWVHSIDRGDQIASV